MIAAAKSGKGLGGATAAAPPVPAVGAAKAWFTHWDLRSHCSALLLSSCMHTDLCPLLSGTLLILVCILQTAPSVTQALSSRDTNRQPTAAAPPGKKPLRPAATTQQQNSKSIADDDDAALQVGIILLCMVSYLMVLIML